MPKSVKNNDNFFDSAEVIISENIPFGICLYVLPDTEADFINKIIEKYPGKYKILLVQGFPYGTDSMSEILSKLTKKYPYITIKILLLDEKKSFSATDISTPDKAREKARQVYKSKNSNCLVRSESMALCVSNYSITGALLTRFKQKLETVKDVLDSFEIEFKYDPKMAEIYEQFEMPDMLEKYFCKFSLIKKNENIINAYIRNFTKFVNDPNGDFCTAITEFYKKTIGIIKFYDIQKDITGIFKEINDKFVDTLKIFSTKTLKFDNEIDYRTGSHKLQIQFKKIVQDFMKNTLPGIINRKINCEYQLIYNKAVNNANIQIWFQ
jgi:hypothetical protein